MNETLISSHELARLLKEASGHDQVFAVVKNGWITIHCPETETDIAEAQCEGNANFELQLHHSTAMRLYIAFAAIGDSIPVSITPQGVFSFGVGQFL